MYDDDAAMPVWLIDRFIYFWNVLIILFLWRKKKVLSGRQLQMCLSVRLNWYVLASVPALLIGIVNAQMK